MKKLLLVGKQNKKEAESDSNQWLIMMDCKYCEPFTKVL